MKAAHKRVKLYEKERQNVQIVHFKSNNSKLFINEDWKKSDMILFYILCGGTHLPSW